MKVRFRFLFCLFIFIILYGRIVGQNLPILWGHRWSIGARDLALGGGYTAVADDYSALYYNPAGLGQIRHASITGSFSHLSLTNRATFWGTTREEGSSYTRLHSLGMVIPAPTIQGSLVFGFGYHRFRQFDWATHVFHNINDTDYSATLDYRGLEEGGFSLTSIGGGVEIGPDLFLGGAVNFWGGDDDYTLKFGELNVISYGKYFADSTVVDHILTDFSGLNFTLSMLYRYNRFLRIGSTIMTPVTLKAQEEWDWTISYVWEGSNEEVDSDFGTTEYKIQTPWIFRAGGAFEHQIIMISGEIEFIDYSQSRYKTDPPEADAGTMSDVNLQLRSLFKQVINYRLGAELAIFNRKIRLRGGYGFIASPWRKPSDNEDREVFSFGVGIQFNDQIIMDLGYANTSWRGHAYFTDREDIDACLLMSTVHYHW